MTFEVIPDRRLIRSAGGSVRYVLASHVAETAQSTRQRAPVNIALVLDRSGSMGGQKIHLARQAVIDALRMLKHDDRFAVVAYDDQIDIVVESTPATREAIVNAVRAVERIDARGSTDLAGGWMRGCEQIAQHLRSGSISRCLLMTDGLANQGITDPGELERHAAALRERGIVTSTFGIGSDFNEVLLQQIARTGGGQPYYIEVAANIRDALTGEVGEALEVTERNVELIVNLPAGVSAEVITMHGRATPAPGQVAVRLGDLVSDQETAVVLALRFPEGEEGILTSARFELRRRDAQAAQAELTWTFRSHEDNDRQPRETTVDRVVASAYAARVRHEATTMNERGEFEQARRALQACAKKIRSYANGDRELLRIAEELESEVVPYSVLMTGAQLKQARYASYNVAMLRAPDGKAKRRK